MRKITSFSLGISFIIMTYTGIMLFICPHGRVAYWSDWHFLGLSKDQYGNLHTTSMIVFVLFGILHIYYNWRVILNYLKDKSRKISFSTKEFLIALGLNIVFVVGTLAMIQPFSGFLTFENNLKESWTAKAKEPPYGHAELSKLEIFCKRVDIPLQEATKQLSENGIKFSTKDTLLTIAKNNNMNPSEVYNIIKQNNKVEISADAIPTSLGKKTLKELTSMKKIELTEALNVLKNKGVKHISKDSKIKEIADELSTTPIEIYNMIKK